MRQTFPSKVQYSPRASAWLPLCLWALIWLAGCGGTKKLNYRNGRYYTASEIARMKAAERRGGTVSKTKVKTKPGSMSSGGRKIVAHAPKRTSSSAAATKQMAQVIEAARSYQGTPYKFGGTTRLGMDCSGLLNVSFAAAGIQIPRSSNEQAAWGAPVRPQDLQVGDLVFFGASPGSSAITHVGLVTEVTPEGVQFIHSSTSLGVVENALESDYYLSRFIKAVRPKL